MPFAPFIKETVEVPNKNVIASMAPPPTVRGVTILAGTADIVPGRVLGKITATGKYAIYNNGNANGTEVASAIALNFAPLDADRDQNIHVAIGGYLVLDQLVGLDSFATTDLKGEENALWNIFKF